MKPAIKRTLWIVGVLVALVLAASIYLLTQLNPIVARLIEEQGSRATQTDVRVDGVDISLREASGRIDNLTIANPEGFPGNAIELGSFSISIDGSSLGSDAVVLEDVTVDGARLNLLQEGARVNLRVLLDNLASGESEPADDSGPGVRLIIDRFVLSDARVFISAPDLGEDREVVLPEIVLTGVGRRSNGATGAELARQLLVPVLERALQSAAAQTFRERAGEKIDEVKDRLLDGLRDKLGDDDEGN